MHQYHISNAIFLLNGFPKKRDVCEKIMFRAWVGAPLKATLSQEPPCLHAPQPLFVNPAPPWPCPHVCPPRQVHIRISSYQCGGVLLNHWYIATAAHCVHRAKLSKITVRSQIDFLQNLFCFWSRCTLVNMTRRTGKRSRWTARPTKSTTLSFILILGEGLPCKYSCNYGSSWFNRAHEWISWSSNNVKKAWKRDEGPSCSPSYNGPWPSLLTNTTLAATTLDKHHLSNHLCRLPSHHTHHPGNRLSRQTPLQPLCAPRQLTVYQRQILMLRNALPISLKLKKLNCSVNIPCRVCFYLCMRTPCHWAGFLCRPIQYSLLSLYYDAWVAFLHIPMWALRVLVWWDGY